MTDHDPNNLENSDNFDRLLANRQQIAEFVNSFTSERVQRKAFEAVVCSLGLVNDDSASSAPVERLHVVPPATPEAEDAVGDETGEPDAASPTRRRKSKSSGKKNFTVPRGLNFAPEGHPTFEAFIAEKAPKNNDERSLIACHYLGEMMGIVEVGIGHILAAYQAAEWSAPAHPDTALRAAASRTGWLDTADTKAIKVVWKGENYIATKMPAEQKKKSS
ncbi:hypothetical protein EUA93_12640 [Nocardioides oleivorans]|uniref:Uncharacterized protein n=1 Tax=Nocardioides oleivorans TaxID=273676 RepID=A0A4Q2S1P0_9ACTN|nr:hypothetical protein [Nocardioides oleivorans]RYB95116.1 hypothetical protein EUA93_12640 [Nocardioides oleivorans]